MISISNFYSINKISLKLNIVFAFYSPEGF